VAVDKVLESCFQLISLFFMTIGRTTEAPAAYALTSTIKRLLDHLTESRLFSAKDLNSIADTLGKLDGILKNTNSEHSPYLVELLANREELCKKMLVDLRKQLDELEEPLQAVYERLISILRSMSLANTKAKVTHSYTCREPRTK
jgi:ABC-type transporter Mla subunit MlaD